MEDKHELKSVAVALEGVVDCLRRGSILPSHIDLLEALSEWFHEKSEE